MNVILLCAGYATRLYPLTKDNPKPLLPVAGKPIIEYFLRDVAAIDDIETIFIVTNHKFAHVFEEWKKSFTYSKPIEIIDDNTTSNDDRLGAIGDIWYTIQQKSIESDVLIVGGDNIFDMDVNECLSFALSHVPYATIAAYDVTDIELAKKYGLVVLDDAGQVVEFQEKPQEPRTTLASLAFYYYPQEALRYLKRYIDEGNNQDQPGNFVAWLARKYKVFSYTFNGSWFDIGDFDSLELANKHYENENKTK